MSWTTVKVASSLDVEIPEKIKDVCDYYANKIEEEFAVLTNIAKEKNGKVFLSNEFYIPKQTVSSAYIIIDPEDTNVGNYNTIIHRHPDGMHSFSKTDEDNINLNFKCSFLYTQRSGFVKGIYNVDVHTGIMTRLDFNLNAQNTYGTSLIKTYGDFNPKNYFGNGYSDSDTDDEFYKKFQDICSDLWRLHPYFETILIRDTKIKTFLTEFNESIEQLYFLTLYKDNEFMLENLQKINTYVEDIVNSWNVVSGSSELDKYDAEFKTVNSMVKDLHTEWFEIVDIDDPTKSDDSEIVSDLADDISDLELRIEHIEDYLSLDEDSAESSIKDRLDLLESFLDINVLKNIQDEINSLKESFGILNDLINK